MLIYSCIYKTFKVGQKAGHLLSCAKTHLLDNIRLQTKLTFETNKLLVNLKFKRLQGMNQKSRITEWPLFAHTDMTWGEFRYAVLGEIQALQA